MAICFLHGNGGAGSGGKNAGTLSVSAPSDSTVTVSKDDKSYSKVVDSSEVVVFKGLEDGTWTVSASKGLQSAITTVEITTAYDSVIVYFTATIVISYPEGSTCKATCGPVELEAPDTSGSWTCTVPLSGTWRISITDGSRTIYRDVVIETSGQSEEVSLAYRFVVFDQGNSCDVPAGTEGWAGTGDATGNRARVTNGGSGPTWVLGRYLITIDPIDFSSYSTLHVVVTTCHTTSKFGFGSVADQSTFDGEISVKRSSAEATYTFDVTDFNGAYYIKLYTGGGQVNTGEGYREFGFSASKIWLD